MQDIIAIQSGSPDAGSIYPKPSTGDTNDNGTTFSVVFRFSHSNATPAPLVAPHILQRPSDVDLVLSPTNTESSTTSPFTPSSSVSVSTNFRVPWPPTVGVMFDEQRLLRATDQFLPALCCCFTDEIETSLDSQVLCFLPLIVVSMSNGPWNCHKIFGRLWFHTHLSWNHTGAVTSTPCFPVALKTILRWQCQ